jgi:stringent starvation protein B
MAEEQPLTPRRPYLLRAMHEWMTDNGQTPHVVVDAAVDGVVVPRQYVRDGRIILNVGYSATAGLVIRNDSITFSARFGGAAFDVSLPLSAVLGIYAAETGQGMIFAEDEPGLTRSDAAEKPTGSDEPRRPQLKIIK